MKRVHAQYQSGQSCGDHTGMRSQRHSPCCLTGLDKTDDKRYADCQHWRGQVSISGFAVSDGQCVCRIDMTPDYTATQPSHKTQVLPDEFCVYVIDHILEQPR